MGSIQGISAGNTYSPSMMAGGMAGISGGANQTSQISNAIVGDSAQLGSAMQTQVYSNVDMMVGQGMDGNQMIEMAMALMVLDALSPKEDDQDKNPLAAVMTLAMLSGMSQQMGAFSSEATTYSVNSAGGASATPQAAAPTSGAGLNVMA